MGVSWCAGAKRAHLIRVGPSTTEPHRDTLPVVPRARWNNGRRGVVE